MPETISRQRSKEGLLRNSMNQAKTLDPEWCDLRGTRRERCRVIPDSTEDLDTRVVHIGSFFFFFFAGPTSS